MTFTRTRIAWTVGLLLLLAVVVAIVLLPRLLGEQRIRAEAERQLAAVLGLPVRIAGPLQIDVGTTTRVDASDVTIGEVGAGRPPLLVLGRVQASLATGSLLTGAPAIGDLRLEEPRVHLHVDREGRTNWARSPTPAPAGDGGAPAWSIDSLTIERGELRYTDERSGADFALHDWHLRAGRIALPAPIDAETRFEARRAGTPLARVRLRARVTADPALERYALDGIDLAADVLRGTGPLPVTVAAERLEYSGRDAAAAVRGLRLAAAGLALRADGTVTQLASSPAWEATVATEPFAPREVLRAFGAEAPPMAGPGALERAQLGGRVRLRDGTAQLAGLDASLDETRLSGGATVTTAAPRRWTFDLEADRIAADRYRAPRERRDTSPVVLPLDFLRGLDVEGRLRVGQLVVAGVTLRDVTIDLGAEARREAKKDAGP